MDSSFKEVFNSLQLMIAFRKSIILKRVIGTNTIRNNQKFLTPAQQQPQVNVPHVTPFYRFAANNFSK